jgi:hypothetical protein
LPQMNNSPDVGKATNNKIEIAKACRSVLPAKNYSSVYGGLPRPLLNWGRRRCRP